MAMVGDHRDAGWYAHPQKPKTELYWDGDRWTDQERPAPAAPTASALEQQQAKIVCQFCQQAGGVTVGRVRRAKRKTFTRLAGAVVTAGGSLPLTGVSKKGTVTQLHCSNCGMTWDAPQTTF